MKFILLFFAAALTAAELSAQSPVIIPRPQSLEVQKGQVTINRQTRLLIKDEGDRAAADFFNNYLDEVYGFRLTISSADQKGNYVMLQTRKFIQAPEKDSYELQSDKTGVRIEGDSYAGTFYGVQTLIQLLPTTRTNSLKIPLVIVKDAPRFDYRGLHLDVARHFFPVDFIKKYIDYIALHKMNYFHWHLTDDQGWRIEIKKYPRLTQVGGWRNGTIIGRFPGTGNDGLRYGGFYTQDQIREVVEYAARRHITVVPEIELPGHASAAIAAYPILSCFPMESTQPNRGTAWAGPTTGKQVQQGWGVFDDVFCAGKETTFQFLQDVMDEVLTLFPSKLIHVGGDECPKVNWKRCPMCQIRMKDNQLKDEHELQSYFIQRMEKYLNTKGREIIGWDEILEGGLAPNAAVMSWRGEEGGIAAAQQKHKVVMTPGGWMYFDHTQSMNEDSVTIGGYTTVEKVYSYNPVPALLNAEEARYIMGAQANLWTEYIKNYKKLEYMLLPRLSALSEVLWTDSSLKSWADFEPRLLAQFRRYDLWGANYSRAYFDLQSNVKPGENGTVIWELSTRQPGAEIQYKIHPNAELTKSGAPAKKYTAPLSVNANTQISAWAKNGNPVTQAFHFSKSTGRPVTISKQPAKNYPGDGAFTLVNGVINNKGLGRSREFLGFEGSDCEVVIDLQSEQNINEVIVHSLAQGGSWVYPPSKVVVSYSNDGVNFELVPDQKMLSRFPEDRTIEVKFNTSLKARYVKVLVQNFGVIPEGMTGAGHGAWLFVDEIEVK
jgi:hexosaminidase